MSEGACPGTDDEELLARVEAGLVHELTVRSVTAVAALLVLLPLLPQVLGDAVSEPGVRVGLWLLFALVVVRLALLLVLRLARPRTLTVRYRRALLVLGSTVVAGGFAVLNLVVVPILDDTHAALLAVCHAGISSVALVSMAGSLGGYLVYIGLGLGSFLAALAPDIGSPVRRLLGFLVVLFIVCLGALAVHVHRALRRSLLLAEKLGEAALRDSLTGLRNRRFLAEAMPSLSARVLSTWSGPEGARRPIPRDSLAILVIDLDRFKEVNDRFSHAAGDAVLVELAGRLRDNVRREDLVVRWGGEEFVLVVAGADRGPDLPIAERIRTAVAAEPFSLPNGLKLPITCSVGTCLFPFSSERPAGLTWEDVLNVADLALRTAKQRGRNRSVEITCGEGALGEPETARSLVDGYLERAEEHGLIRLSIRTDPVVPAA